MNFTANARFSDLSTCGICETYGNSGRKPQLWKVLPEVSLTARLRFVTDLEGAYLEAWVCFYSGVCGDKGM